MPQQPCTFFATIRSWRQSKKLTMPQAATELGVNLRTYQDWEQGRRIPGLRTATPVIRRLYADGFSI